VLIQARWSSSPFDGGVSLCQDRSSTKGGYFDFPCNAPRAAARLSNDDPRQLGG